MKNTSDYEKNCVNNTMKIIGSKWTALILQQLCDGTKRFGELQRAVDNISPKTLSMRLQQLEKEGVINKKIYAEIPLHVEYSLTPKGLALKDVIAKMQQWGDKYSANGKYK